MSSYTQLQYEKHMSNFCSPILIPITNPHTLLDIKKTNNNNKNFQNTVSLNKGTLTK